MRTRATLFGLALLTAALAGCAFGWGGGKAPQNSARPADSVDELSSLRAERDQLRARLASSKVREDTRNFRNDAFPASGGMGTWQMEGRLSELEHRIKALEEAGPGANTSVEEANP